MNSVPLLEVRELTKHFGGLAANTDIDFAIHAGEVVGVIGPNGAGKTTLFNCVAGFYAPTRGKVFFEGADVTGTPPHRMAEKGLGRTFQVMTSSGDMTALETVMTGAFLRTASRSAARAEAERLLSHFGISGLKDALVPDLPVAAQKLTSMAAALATKPKLVLLDEVAAGLNPGELAPVTAAIAALRKDFGVTVLLIEHILDMVMKLSDRLIVLNYGRVIADGEPSKVSTDPEVVKAYLGERFAARLLEQAEKTKSGEGRPS